MVGDTLSGTNVKWEMNVLEGKRAAVGVITYFFKCVNLQSEFFYKYSRGSRFSQDDFLKLSRSLTSPNALHSPCVDGHFVIAIVTADPLHNKEATVRVILEKGGDYLVGTKANTSKRLEGAAEPLRGSLFELSCEGQRGRTDSRQTAVEPLSPVTPGLPGALCAMTNPAKRPVKQSKT